MEFPPEGYRRSVGICLCNYSGKIFAASRLNRPDIWEIPQEGANEGKNLKTAVKRELTEETGVVSAEIIAELPYWLTCDFPPELSIKLSKHWGVTYKGQDLKAREQTSRFLLKFTGKDEEINLLGDGTEKQEFGKWLWMSIEQILNQPAYDQVMKEFGRLIQGNEEDDISIKQSETQLD